MESVPQNEIDNEDEYYYDDEVDGAETNEADAALPTTAYGANQPQQTNDGDITPPADGLPPTPLTAAMLVNDEETGFPEEEAMIVIEKKSKFNKKCIIWSTIIIGILAILIALIPILIITTTVASNNAAVSESSSGAALKVVDTATYRYKLTTPVFEADTWGDKNLTQDHYPGLINMGWQYVGNWDWKYSEKASQKRLYYPLLPIRARVGDRIVFRNQDDWALKDDCWLVTKEIYDACDFNAGGNGGYYLLDNGQANPNSKFRLFGAGEVFTNRKLWKYKNLKWDDFDKYNQYVFTIPDAADLLPCKNWDLWCKLVTADTLYFVSMYLWDKTWSDGNCNGWYKDKGSKGGLKQIVYVDRRTPTNMQMASADINGLLDPKVVSNLEFSIGTIGRTLILSQFSTEQRVRSEGHSGLTNVRGFYDGDSSYDDGTYANDGVASIHDHADNTLVVGIGEIQAVLNGVEFRTRHNDYNLNQPSTTSKIYNAVEAIEPPDVPPAVLKAGGVNAQITEMQKWFKAFKEQDYSVRDYRPYFKPILCYLEGTWVLDDGDLTEPFDSDRHSIAARSWKQLHDKIRWMSNSGRKNSLENLAHLPSSIRGLVNDTYPVVSNWEYRMLCAPLKNDIPTSRFQVADDLSVQLMGSPLTRDELFRSRKARFMLNTYINSNNPDNTDHRWSPGRKKWNYLDYLMEQIPGKDNYGANIVDQFPDGSEQATHYVTGKTLNSAYYSRFYGKADADAMGSTRQRRGWADRYLFAAKTTQEKVSPIQFDFGQTTNGVTKFIPTVSRWSYAIPFEIIYQTPLSKWNPYNIQFTARNNFDYSRTGVCGSKPFKGYTTNRAYYTPASFFEGVTTTSSADTAKGTVCALDSKGVSRNVMASGHWITFPEIGGDVGKVRQRYPIFPIHDDGYAAYKEVKALEDVMLAEDYDDTTSGKALDFFGDGRDSKYGFTLYLQGGGHQHEMYIPAWKVRYFWFDSKTGWYLSGEKYNFNQDTEERESHTHTVKIWRWRNNSNSPWNYVLQSCRWGSLSDKDVGFIEWKCADNHNELVRD